MDTAPALIQTPGAPLLNQLLREFRFTNAYLPYNAEYCLRSR
ncbi:Unknown protein sequence [Pseudomonas savastanoi pv. phaseolicola]|nr:Unknown protein sequence [Pseudomonas savastanoi pv. phaseolicola]KPB68258.1 Unknown protein sequence [Pseudomonas amygdali pv. mellea]